MRGSNHSQLIACLLLMPLLLSGYAGADEQFHRLRGDTAIDEIAPAPPLSPYQKTTGRQLRNYPEQPPIIPHSIAGYEISLRGNKCLSCHSRRRSVETDSPMVSVSHFTNRELQVLSDLSARRYFCTQCHVPQAAATPPVDNTFIDAADLP